MIVDVLLDLMQVMNCLSSTFSFVDFYHSFLLVSISIFWNLREIFHFAQQRRDSVTPTTSISGESFAYTPNTKACY